jgi:hypothetical protein
MRYLKSLVLAMRFMDFDNERNELKTSSANPQPLRLMLWSSPVRCGLLLICMWAWFGDARAAESNPPINQIETNLLKGTDTQRAALAAMLGLVIPKSTRAGLTADVPCTLFESVKADQVSLRSKQMQTVLEVYSRLCGFTYLVVLNDEKDGSWTYDQTITVPSNIRTPEISYVSLVTPDVKEIIVRDQVTDNGSGIFEDNMIIWRWFPGGFRVIFDEPSQVVLAVPTEGGNSDQHEESTFSIVNGQSVGVSTSQAIVQRQTIRQHETSIVRFWVYAWSPELGLLQKYPWTGP